MLPVDSGFHTWKNFTENCPQFGHPPPRDFAISDRSRKSLKNSGSKERQIISQPWTPTSLSGPALVISRRLQKISVPVFKCICLYQKSHSRVMGRPGELGCSWKECCRPTPKYLYRSKLWTRSEWHELLSSVAEAFSANTLKHRLWAYLELSAICLRVKKLLPNR